MQVDNSNITHKIDSLVQKLVGKFRSLYVPPEVIVVDESMIKFYGRLRIKTYNPSKASSYGIKVYKLCTVNSYTWSYEIYAGASIQYEGLDKPGTVVGKLCEPLLDQGRVLIADNYYTSVPLPKYLKDRKTDLCGTLRKNRVGLPLNVTKSKLKKGQWVARQKDNYITVLKWHDKRDVLMISTCHGDEMTSVRTRLGETLKPNAVIDYNDAKKGIDVADQLSSYHSPLHKSLTWFKKVAVDLLFRVAVVNARCIYNEYSTGAPLTMLEVQEQIIRHLLGPSANVTTPAHTCKRRV
ncbi:piggyBac transposable element-derived protein 4-like [Hermetia illucens]|uniref:piggyBac transposable element-derived protein 4-like n=1 Tax=Hermetia illucens TaxID=343691 RepID=UPI0018CC63B4|nr:piggyBac transposable element-derived protein 4-like [Hermetia illucens]